MWVARHWAKSSDAMRRVFTAVATSVDAVVAPDVTHLHPEAAR
jgi:hypothetical protein